MRKIYQNSVGGRCCCIGGGWGLQVKPLGRALLLLVQDVLLGFLEIFVGDFHAALPQSHEACFCADGLKGLKEETVDFKMMANLISIWESEVFPIN